MVATSNSSATKYIPFPLHTTCCLRGGRAPVPLLLDRHMNIAPREECAAKCRRNSACRFFSHTPFVRKGRQCLLCASCTLDSSKSAHGFTSYAAVNPRLFDTVVDPATVIAELSRQLQGRYSEELYGAQGRVPAQNLRIVWTRLLPRDALAWLAQVGVCSLSTIPPFLPFYAAVDAIGGGNPLDAVWVHHHQKMRGFPNGSWVEVVHCPQNIAVTPEDERVCETARAARRAEQNATGETANNTRRGKRVSKRLAFMCASMRHQLEWQWRSGSMWFYATPGSGVSINIGRTRVFGSYEEAKTFLQSAMRADGKRSWSTCHAATIDESGAGAELDSVQILHHKEYYSLELRHEILMLRHGECETLAPSTPFLACGRHPDLYPCRAETLSRLSRCGTLREVRRSHPGELRERACNSLPDDRGGRGACYHTGSSYKCQALAATLSTRANVHGRWV